MDFHVLGALDVVHNGSSLDLGTHKQRSLLALLLMHANRVVSTDRILDELWGEEAEGKENALWVYVSRLRSALEPERVERGESSVLLTRDHGYMISVDPEAIDAHRFEAAASAGRSLIKDDPAAASTTLHDALQLWRGDPFEDFAYDEFARTEIARLEELRLTALQDRIEADLRSGRAGDLIGELEVLCQEHPLRERPVAQLMLALYRAGRQAEALRTFERFRRGLGEELGTEPSPELRRLEEQVLLHDSRIQARRPAAGRTVGSGRVPTTNPFKGLRAFREDDGGDFFGRDRLVADIARRIDRGDRLIGLVGPSGSGKSSLVKAGLIPALRKAAIPGSDRWLIAQMVPGAHPFAELEAALARSSLDAPESMAELLSDPETGLLRAALRLLPGDDSRLLLVVDQFEELFTLVDDEEERSRFIASLLPALDDPHGRVIVVLTLRADFYGRPLSYPDFGTRLGDGVVNVVPLTPDELEEAAQKPAERAGVSFEPALLAALLTDVVGQSGALPAFQYALTELFDRRVGDTLTLDTYRAMDGVRGALTRRADDLYTELDTQEQAAAKQLLLRLVAISDGDEWGRRRVPASEIVSLDVDVVALQGVIEQYTQHRLLTLDRDFVTGSPTVEVAHEALLTQWKRLRAWIEESREDVQRHAALTAAMNEWSEAGRDTDYLLAGARLEAYEQWSTTAVMGLTSDEKAFLEASVEVREQATWAEEARIAQEERTERTARRRLWGLAAAVVLLVGAGIAALVVALAPDPLRVGMIGFERDGLAGINDSMIDGFEAAQRDSGFTDVSLNPISDPLSEVAELLDGGADLIITDQHALFDLELDPWELAETYDEVDFVFIEAPGGFVDLPNVTHIFFEAEQGSFLAGVAAARTSRTGKVGFIGGIPVAIDSFRAGFEAGARYAKPNIEIVSRYLLGRIAEVFGDPELSEAAAREMYALGVDVIYHAAGTGGRGIFTAAADESDGSDHRWVIGVDVDEYIALGAPLRDHALTSMLKRHDEAVKEAVRRFMDGTLESGFFVMDFENGGLDYSRLGGFLGSDTEAALTDVRAAIIAGEIEVPAHPGGPESDPPQFDTEVTVTFDGQQCELAGAVDPDIGEVLRVRFENTSGAQAAINVFPLIAGTSVGDLAESDPWSLSDGGMYTGASALSGGSHAVTVRLDANGPWSLACFDADGTYSYAPLLTVTGG